MATTTTVKGELKKALFTYGRLKSRLLSAIETGQYDFSLKNVGKDDQCDLGFLIYDTGDLQNLNQVRFDRLRRAHKQLHKQMEAVLLLATAGKRYEASSLLAPGSAFAQAQSALERELNEWCSEIR